MLINNTSKAIFNGNGMTTEFPFSFKVWDIAQLIVTIIDDKGFESTITNFTATLNDNGGSVIYLHDDKPLPSGYKLVILRNMPFTQNVDLITGTRFDPQVIEDALDKATAERQQLQEALGRSVKISPASNFTADELLQQIFTAQSESAKHATVAIERANATISDAEIATLQANRAKAEADRAAAATGTPDGITIEKSAEDELFVVTTPLAELSAEPTPEELVRPAQVGDVYKLSPMFNTKQVFEASGTFTAPVSGWYKVTCIGGGSSGATSTCMVAGSDTTFANILARGGSSLRITNNGFFLQGGACGEVVIDYVYLEKDQEVSYIVGAGGVAVLVVITTDYTDGIGTMGSYMYEGGTQKYNSFGPNGRSNNTGYGGGGGCSGYFGSSYRGQMNRGNGVDGGTTPEAGSQINGNGGDGAIFIEYYDPNKPKN